MPVRPAKVRDPMGAVGIINNLNPEAVKAAVKVAAMIAGSAGRAGVQSELVAVRRLERGSDSIGGHILIMHVGGARRVSGGAVRVTGAEPSIGGHPDKPQ